MNYDTLPKLTLRTRDLARRWDTTLLSGRDGQLQRQTTALLSGRGVLLQARYGPAELTTRSTRRTTAQLC